MKMRLTPAQLAQFDRDGSLFFPGQFTPEETKVLTAAVPAPIDETKQAA